MSLISESQIGKQREIEKQKKSRLLEKCSKSRGKIFVCLELRKKDVKITEPSLDFRKIQKKKG